MQINSFKLKSKTNANKFVVNTDSGEFLLHADAIVKYHISKGKVDDKAFYLALDESNKIICLDMATKYLSNTIKTERQVKDYLYKKGCEASSINYAIDKLKEYGIINDETFAKSYTASNPRFSRGKLNQKLNGFGVKNFDVSSIVDDEQESNNCLISAQKFVKNKELTKQVADKLVRHLQSKGFNWDTIKPVLTKLKLENLSVEGNNDRD